MQASGSGKDFTLDGTKMYVIDGNSAEILIVAARTDNGVSLFQVDANAEGLTRTSWPQWIRHANNLALTLKALPPN